MKRRLREINGAIIEEPSGLYKWLGGLIQKYAPAIRSTERPADYVLDEQKGGLFSNIVPYLVDFFKSKREKPTARGEEFILDEGRPKVGLTKVLETPAEEYSIDEPSGLVSALGPYLGPILAHRTNPEGEFILEEPSGLASALGPYLGPILAHRTNPEGEFILDEPQTNPIYSAIGSSILAAFKAYEEFARRRLPGWDEPIYSGFTRREINQMFDEADAFRFAY